MPTSVATLVVTPSSVTTPVLDRSVTAATPAHSRHQTNARCPAAPSSPFLSSPITIVLLLNHCCRPLLMEPNAPTAAHTPCLFPTLQASPVTATTALICRLQPQSRCQRLSP
ncbi:hypothetical protein GW17_00039697 [Ensete ventricosum]|nr:hypothetical protein GW17_00039697 [Ensete ventricosum]